MVHGTIKSKHWKCLDGHAVEEKNFDDLHDSVVPQPRNTIFYHLKVFKISPLSSLFAQICSHSVKEYDPYETSLIRDQPLVCLAALPQQRQLQRPPGLLGKFKRLGRPGRVTHGCPPTIALHCIAVGAGKLLLVGLGLYKAYFPKNNICKELF